MPHKSYVGVVDEGADSTKVSILGSAVDPDLAVLAPPRSPRIFDDVVGGSIGEGSDADDLRGMAQDVVVSAEAEDAWPVELPVFVDSVETDQCRSWSECILEDGAAGSSESCKWKNPDFVIGRIFAFVDGGSIWVVFL